MKLTNLRTLACKRLSLRSLVIFISVACMSSNALSESIDPDKIIEADFWGKLHSEGGNTFYCEKPFTEKTHLIKESYVYPTRQMRDHLQCGTNRLCKKNSEAYNKMLADLHNIVPVDSVYEFKLKSSHFGILDPAAGADECGVKKSFHLIEPRDSIKGDVARILLYMQDTYDLPLIMPLADIELWNQLDPPDGKETARNAKILELQGTSNTFVTPAQQPEE